MSKFIVANLASVFVLMAAGSVFAAPDSNTSTPPADQTSASASAAQSPAPSSDVQTPPSKPAQAAKQKSPSDIICKPDTGTGSRVGGVKICLTREQWKERDD